MSHIVQTKTDVRDPIAVISACSWLRLPRPLQAPFQLLEVRSSNNYAPI